MERQEGITLSTIRKDHLVRYNLAKQIIIKKLSNKKIIDVASGVGYGSYIMSEVSDKVISIEINKTAHDKAKKYFAKENIEYVNSDVFDYSFSKSDMIVCFEFLEHIKKSKKLIKTISLSTNKLLISTPNELVRPYKQHPINSFHYRHWSPNELEELLDENGFKVIQWFYQKSGKYYDIKYGTNGKFIIAYCEK